MVCMITGVTIYVKIKDVAKRRKQLKRIWLKPFEKEFKRFEKVVDSIQTKWYTKWVAWLRQIKTISYNVSCTKENGLWKLNRII